MNMTTAEEDSIDWHIGICRRLFVEEEAIERFFYFSLNEFEVSLYSCYSKLNLRACPAVNMKADLTSKEELVGGALLKSMPQQLKPQLHEKVGVLSI